MTLNALIGHRPPCKASHERNANSWLMVASEYRRATDECEIPPLDIRVQAIQLSPYRAGVAGPCPTRLLSSPAFPPCSCSLSFQSQVRRVASKSLALNFGPLWGQFVPYVPWRTVSVSRGSPVIFNDAQSCFGIPHLAYLADPQHRITCSPSPALPRTRSPFRWSASQRHTLQSVCVRPLQPSDLGTTRTPGP